MNRQTVLQQLKQQQPLIAPSMLKCDFGNLQREFALLEQARAAVIHLDVMDGHFVPNLSYGPMVIERMRELTETPFDAHLMISEPARYLDAYLQAGCELITFHLEAEPEPADLLRRIRDHEVCAGLAINPDTPVEQVEPYLELCDLVLVMSVEPGFGGQQFNPVAVGKLRQLRNLAPDLLLSVDGGIDTETIGSTAEAGANLFVCGSSIFETEDYSESIRALRAAALQSPASSSLEP